MNPWRASCVKGAHAEVDKAVSISTDLDLKGHRRLLAYPRFAFRSRDSFILINLKEI